MDHLFKLVLVTLSLLLSSSLASHNDSIFTAKTHVYVKHDIRQINTSMLIKCRSKDDDLGDHELKYGEFYSWGFRVNIFQETVFWCDFAWTDPCTHQQVQGTYDVFRAHKDVSRCGVDCKWSARRSGIYLKSGKHGEYNLIYAWPYD